MVSVVNKPTPFEIQKTVVFGLFIRELKTRFGKYRLGYFWAFFDPMAHVLIISVLFVAGFKTSSIRGISPPLLILTGIIPFFLFRDILMSSLRAVDSNRGLFSYRRVKPADAVIARVLLESLISIFVFSILIVVFARFGYTTDFSNPVAMIGSCALLIIFSSGVGFILCVIGTLYPEIAKIIPVLIRSLYFVSGVFFPADSVPAPLRKYLLLNPLVHSTELLRSSLIDSYNSESVSFKYLFFSAFITFFFGLAYYRINRISIITSRNQ